MTTTAIKQQEREAVRAAYIAYATKDIQVDEDARGPFAMMLSGQRDGSRYEVRVCEHTDGSMFAESCECWSWRANNPHAVCCKHMEAFNVWHMAIFHSVTVMPVCETFDHEERWPEVEICALAAPQKRQDAPCKGPELDTAWAQEAGKACGKASQGQTLSAVAIAKRANAWIRKQGYIARTQKTAREAWTAGFTEGKDLAEQIWNPGDDPVALRIFAEQICNRAERGLFEQIEHPVRGDAMHSTTYLYSVIYDLYINLHWSRVRIQKWLDAEPSYHATTRMERAALTRNSGFQVMR